MITLDPQTLMAYADGELDASQRLLVEEALALSPQLQLQLSEMSRLDTLLGAAFSDPLHGPQPALRALHSTALSDPLHGPKPALSALDLSAKSASAGLKLWHGVSEYFTWQGVAAAAALLMLGAGSGGWYERQAQRAEVAVNQQQLEMAIERALETHLSGEPLQWGGAKAERVGSITPLRTYKSDQGQYCREFMQRRSDAGRVSEQRGVACRGEKGWQLKANYYL